MRFSSYNMEGRIKSKTKFINEGVAECFNSVKYNNHYMLNKHDIDIFEIWNNYDSSKEIILILLLANFALSCWNKVEKIIS